MLAIGFNYPSLDPGNSTNAQNGACLIERREIPAAVFLPWMNTCRQVCVVEDFHGDVFMLFVNCFTGVMIASNDIYLESVTLQK